MVGLVRRKKKERRAFMEGFASAATIAEDMHKRGRPPELIFSVLRSVVVAQEATMDLGIDRAAE